MKKLRISKSSKAGLIFPVTKLKKKLKLVPQCAPRVTEGAIVYLTAVLEYLIAEILEISGNICSQNNLKRISPRHLKLAIGTDKEIEELLKKVIIPGSGVLSKINSILFNKEKSFKYSKFESNRKKYTNIQKIQCSNLQIPILVRNLSNRNDDTGLTILSEKKLKTGQKINVIQADILKLKVDAIVHPTNASFYLGGQIGQAIQNIGGQKIKKILFDLYHSRGPLRQAEVEISKSTENMNCQKIIHIFSPSWNISNQSKCIQELIDAVNNILKVANYNNINSLAIPSISSGSNGFPKQIAAETILTTINNFFRGTEEKISLNQVNFVLYDSESVGIFISELKKLDNI